MKLISFLYPYPIRNTEAPHLWSLYKLLENIPAEDIFCIGSEDYFKGPEYFKEKKRWEYKWASKGWKKSEQISNTYKIDPEIFRPLNEELLTANQVWRSLILKPYSQLVEILDEHISNITKNHKIDAIVTLCNCASLTSVAKKHNISIIHIELGALRAPNYINTGYFDFSGVNANAESEKRYLKFKEEIKSNNNLKFLSKENLLKFIKEKSSKNEKKHSLLKKVKRKIKAKINQKTDNEFNIGLPLQVEDDSNMLAYSNGFNNFELLSYANKFYNKDQILIRKHPSGHANYRVKNEDKSIFPYDFIKRCKSIVTINSSMGLESLLHDKETWIMGKNPFNFCASQNSDLSNYQEAEDITEKLNFAIFGYLVPFDIFLTPEYIKFRLSNPSEIEIYQKHFNYWNDIT